MQTVAAQLGLLAREALQDGQTGRVAAVFENSFYAVLGSHWICVGPRSLGSGPLHVLCDPRPLGWPTAGDPVAVIQHTLHIAHKPFATLDAAALWRPESLPHWTPASLQAGLGIVDAIWRPGEDGLAAAATLLPPPVQQSALRNMAAPGLRALARFIADESERSRPATGKTEIIQLIGLGPGLTPSGDDLLSGALIALATLDRRGIRDRLWALCRPHLDRTSDISAAHFRAAARGYGAAALHAAIHATLEGDASRIAQALAAVTAIGHSSGRDGFAGALIVLRAAARQPAGTGTDGSGSES